MIDDSEFFRWVTKERASRLTGKSVRTIEEWIRKGILKTKTDPGGFTTLIDIEELRPRPKVKTTAQATS